MNLGLSQTVKASAKVSQENKLHLLKHTAEVIMEHIFSNEINPESFEDARTIVDTTISYLAQTPETFDLISALNSHSDLLYAHSLGVSLYSSLIAKLRGAEGVQTPSSAFPITHFP